MVDQVVPITDIASAGVIKDIPSISLPPNAYSDVQNIRFHSGAARKMEGEMDLGFTLPGTFDKLAYSLYWQAPSANYYVLIDNSNPANIAAFEGDNRVTTAAVGTMAAGADADWQHTLFNGGFNLVLNNGVDVPHYLIDGSPTIASLPNWDSYLAQEDVTTVIWDEFNADIELGRPFNPATETLLYTVTPRDTSIGVINYELTEVPNPGDSPVTITRISEDGVDPVDQLVFVTPVGRAEDRIGALPGDTITVSIRTNAEINVRAGVVRAYGNLLIAGDLTETDPDDSSIVRRLPGTIRTSDVAAPGQIPLNWNPFRNGANTADEFILSSTGVVQDMAELQGVMYVYTDVSIHAIQQTGNMTIPFQISTTTDSYGANSLGAVMEFDGRHLVVGSQDIYVFAGHPGSIASISDQRVRHYAYEDADLDINNVRMVRNQKYDEIWIFTPELTTPENDDDPNDIIPAILRDEMLVWNYRTQAWTIRKQSDVNSGSKGKDGPLFTNESAVFIGDAPNVFVKYNDARDVDPPFDGRYISFVARMRLGLTPEFDTETLGSTAMMYTSDVTDPMMRPDLELLMRGSETPSDTLGLPMDDRKAFTFHGMGDYKVDTRIHGRFINYKISDGLTDSDDVLNPNNSLSWNITGYQLEIMKGGKR